MTAKHAAGAKRMKDKHYLKEHQFLFVERPYHEVADEILQWGWSSWWPEQGWAQYRIGEGAVPGAGTACEMVLGRGMLQIRLKGEIVQIKERKAVQIEWQSGMMVGQEFVIVEERSNGTRIDHRLRYRGVNVFAQIVWLVVFRKRYQEGMQQVMDALKMYMGNDSTGTE